MLRCAGLKLTGVRVVAWRSAEREEPSDRIESGLAEERLVGTREWSLSAPATAPVRVI